MSSKRVASGERTGLGAVAKPVLLSVVLGVMVCIGVLMLLSFVLSVRSVPHSLINPLAVFAISVGALVAGFCCAKLLRQGGLAYGALCGAVFSLVIMIASFGVTDNGFGLTAIFKITFMMICAMLGGVFGVNTRRRKR